MLNDGHRARSPTSTLHHKRQSRGAICIPACFSSMSTHPFDVLEDENKANHDCSSRTAPPMSPLPEIKGRCLNLISKIGRGAKSHHRVRRRHASADFSYDPSSYALNFEDDAIRGDDQQLLSARLSAPSIPTLSPNAKPESRNKLDGILEQEETVATTENNKGKSRVNGVAPRRRGRSRHSSVSMDFSYEPSSYAKNFEDDVNRDDEILALRRFGGLLAQPSPS